MFFIILLTLFLFEVSWKQRSTKHENAGFYDFLLQSQGSIKNEML